MTDSQNDLQNKSLKIENYLTMLEIEIGQMNRSLPDLESLVRKFCIARNQDDLDMFSDNKIQLQEQTEMYSAELLNLFPTIENGIINLNGDDRKAFLGYRGRYDVVRNELTNIRRNLFEFEEELQGEQQ